MKKYGIESVLSERIFPKKDEIKKSLLAYYEFTEEYEKCSFIKDFFSKLDKKFQKNT